MKHICKFTASMCGIVIFFNPVHAQQRALENIPTLSVQNHRCSINIGSEFVPDTLKDKHVVVFGIFQGTAEIPRLIGNYICGLIQRDSKRPIVLGLEFDSTEQTLVDTYLSSAGRAIDISRLLSGTQWQVSPTKTGSFEGFQDGRASKANFELIERMRYLKMLGYPISIVLFTPPGEKSSSGKSLEDNGREVEPKMARFIFKALVDQPEARFVIAVSATHAASRRDSGERHNYVPMGQLLRQSGVDVVSLKGIYDGASNHHWGCEIQGYNGGTFDPSMIRCGIYPGPQMSSINSSPTFRLDAFDGTFYVGTTTASPPAVDTTQ